MDIHNITIRAIARSTESEDRVKAALSIFLSGEEIETVIAEGYFGNPILILQAHIKGKNCNKFIELLNSRLSENELKRLKNELCERIDDNCVLHIRFDKQAAYKGAIKPATTSDTITAQLKLKAFPARRERAIAVAEKIFLIQNS